MYGRSFEDLTESSGPCRQRTWYRECREASPDALAGAADAIPPIRLPDGTSLAPAALRSLLLSQGGVLELGKTQGGNPSQGASVPRLSRSRLFS